MRVKATEAGQMMQAADRRMMAELLRRSRARVRAERAAAERRMSPGEMMRAHLDEFGTKARRVES